MSTILIVDDNEQNLYLLHAILTASAYETLDAAHGAEALELARRVHPDLIISDILMPQMDGFTLCRECKRDEQLRDIPIVFYTATYTDPRDEALAMQLGAARFIVKPVENEAFIAIVREVLQAQAAGQLSVPQPPLEEETTFYRLYNETLIRKLENKMLDLEQVNRALAESQERFRILIESLPIGVSLTTLEGQILEANPALLRIFGCESKEEFLQLSAASRLQLLDLSPSVRERYMEQLLTRGAVTDFETQVKRKDGVPFWVRANSVKLITPDGATVLVHSIEDITERKRAQEHIQYQAGLLENVSDAIISTDAQFIVRSWNRAAEELYGWAAQEAIGKPLTEIVPTSYPYEERGQVLARFRADGYWHGEVIQNHRNGTPRCILSSVTLLKDGAGNPDGAVAVNRDITERKRAEEALRASEAHYHTLAQISPVGIFQTDPQGRTYYVNPKWCEISGLTVEEAVGEGGWLDAVHPDDRERMRQHWQEAINLQQPSLTEFRFLRPDGTITWVIGQAVPETNSENQIIGYEGTITDITEHKRQQRELVAVHDAGQQLLRLRTLDELAQDLIQILEITLGYDYGAILLVDSSTNMLLPFALSRQGKGVDFIQVDQSHLISKGIRPGQGITGWVAQHGQSLRLDNAPQDPRYYAMRENIQSELCVPIKVGEAVIGVINIETVIPAAYTENDRRVLETVATQIGIAIQNARLLEETRKRLSQLEAIASVSTALRDAQTRTEMLPVILDQLTSLLKIEGAAIAMREPGTGEILIELARGEWNAWTGLRLKPGEGLSGHVISTGQTYISDDIRNDPRMTHLDFAGDLHAGACVPLIARGQTIGAVWAGRRIGLNADEVQLLTAVSNIAAGAIHRAELYEETVQRVDQLQALQAIDRVITASLDLRLSLKMILEQALSQLHADAVGVLLHNPDSFLLTYAAGRGFHTQGYEHTSLRPGDGQGGQAALERRVIHIADIAQCVPPFARLPKLEEEGFVSYAVTPLVSKGKLKGLLEVFHRSRFQHDEEWLNFLEALAQQTAIAIDNIQLFEGLQQSNLELSLAYNTTIEGWSRALDLRDKETEGHTQRVTEMTLRLARAMGLGEEQIAHTRRGALLHDIGKMGIPDTILHKPDKLTEEEWVMMRRHPVFAHELISPIAYLRPALDIPYCHHEKWDGTGYPRGLKGEQIPLAARLFAVIDVWDALRSDRPYRPAWSRDKTLSHIKSLSGSHFDPKVVDVFFKVFASTGEL